MGSRLEQVLRAGEAHRRSMATGARTTENFSDDELREVLNQIVSGNPKEACRAAANWCALNKRHYDACREGGALWTDLTTRIFGANAPTIDDSGNAQKNFYALCARAAAYRRAARRIEDHPEDLNVQVFKLASRIGLYNTAQAMMHELTNFQGWKKGKNLRFFLQRDGDHELVSMLVRISDLFESLARRTHTRGTQPATIQKIAVRFFKLNIIFEVALGQGHGRAFDEADFNRLDYVAKVFRNTLVRVLVAANGDTGPGMSRINGDQAWDFYEAHVVPTLEPEWLEKLGGIAIANEYVGEIDLGIEEDWLDVYGDWWGGPRFE